MDLDSESEDLVDPLDEEDVGRGVKKAKKDAVEEIFGDDEEEDREGKKRKKHKDELDEIYEKGIGDSGEDIYATEDFERYDDGVSH